MIFKLRIFNWRFTFTFAPVTDLIGVNSTLPDGNHIIMWDFDNIPIELIELMLKWVQDYFDLPNIYILNTGTPHHFIAYCFERCTWRQSVEIVAMTEHVDPNFFKYGVYREHWTLRVSKKEGRKPQILKTLKSSAKETVSISELNSWTKDMRIIAVVSFHSPKVRSNIPLSKSSNPPKIRDTR